MSLHASELVPLVEGLTERLVGAVVQHARQPDPETLVITFRRPGATEHLLLAVGAGRSRLHAIDRPPPNPKAPHAFQGLLRSRLHGRLVGVEQLGGDRVVLLRFQGGDGALTLACELTDRHGNLFLLDADDRILGTLRTSRSERGLRPGAQWTPPLARPSEAPDRFGGDGAAVAATYGARERTERARRQRQGMRSSLVARGRRLRRRAARQRADAARGDEAEGLREEGDLLRGAFALLTRGMSEVEAPDFYRGGTRTLTLDPMLHPGEQINRRYSRAKRAERSAQEAGRRLSETEAELGEVEALLEALDEAGDDDLDEVQGLLPAAPAPKRGKTPQPTRLPYRALWSKAGQEFRVGRGARDNDDLTFRHSRGRDVWLHVRGRPGAHVVIRDPGQAPPLEVLLLGAQLALAGSKAPDGERAEVAWTRVKDVRKPKGLPPGKVLVSQERVLFVEADRAELEQLSEQRPRG